MDDGIRRAEAALAAAGDGATETRVDALNTLDGMDEIRINTRAPLEIMFYLSKGVIVPPKHYECGLAAHTQNADGTPFDWHDVVGDLMTVHVCKSKPKATSTISSICWNAN